MYEAELQETPPPRLLWDLDLDYAGRAQGGDGVGASN